MHRHVATRVTAPLAGRGLQSVSDGVVTIRAPRDGDAVLLVAGRDAEFHRFLGQGSPDPAPTAVVTVGDEVVGWVDADADDDHTWLGPGEVNVGYHLFAPARGAGLATRAVALLLHHLAVSGTASAASVLIDSANAPSLALAGRLRFAPAGDVDGQLLLRRPVPPLTYTDGTVILRPPAMSDVEHDLEAKDEEQIDRLWLPGQREAWEAMSPAEQRSHAERGMSERVASFGRGPKWCFAVDGPDARYVAYVDCDLANDGVPAGEANVSYSAHPAHRGRGLTSAGVRLLLPFLRDHTAAREAHIRVDEGNESSLRVARAVGATEVGREGPMVHHVVSLR